MQSPPQPLSSFNFQSSIFSDGLKRKPRSRSHFVIGKFTSQPVTTSNCPPLSARLCRLTNTLLSISNKVHPAADALPPQKNRLRFYEALLRQEGWLHRKKDKWQVYSSATIASIYHQAVHHSGMNGDFYPRATKSSYIPI